MAKRISRVSVVISDSENFDGALKKFLKLSNSICKHPSEKPLKLKRSWRKKFESEQSATQNLNCKI
jgi:hypothetical protein